MLTHLHATPTKPARVVILGARGFLSRHLQSALQAREIPFDALASSEVDLTRPESVEQLVARIRPDDTVVMMSTLTPDKGRGIGTLMLNLRMGENVCSALAKIPCAHVVYLSSDAVYDAHQIPLDEDSTREPLDLYALTHTAREMMLGSILEKTRTPLAILRPSTVYGPGDTHHNYGPNRFVRSAVRERRVVLFGQGEERRSQVYVADAATLVTRVVLHRSRGTLNLAQRPAVSFREVVDLVRKHLGGDVVIEHAERTVPVVHRPYKPTQIARFIYNLGRPIGPIVHRTFANSAIFAAFPDFTFTSLDEGIAAFVRHEKALLAAEPAAVRSP